MDITVLTISGFGLILIIAILIYVKVRFHFNWLKSTKIYIKTKYIKKENDTTIIANLSNRLNKH